MAAREHQESSLLLREQVHDAVGCAYTHYNLGEISRLRGDLDEAERSLRDSLERFENLGDRMGVAYAEWSLGEVASRQRRFVRAADLVEHALETRQEIGDKRGIIECLEALAGIAVRSGSAQDGVRLMQSTAEQRRASLCPAPPAMRAEHEQTLADAENRLGDAAMAELWRERPLAPDEARILARQIVDRLLGSDGLLRAAG
jgi:tetratricopeptide (TPR) repeat protein